MKFVADEGVDRPIVERLRRDGHVVLYVAEMDPGTSDEEVLNLANREDAVLLTSDKDFGELLFRQRRVAPGIILVRLAGLSQTAKEEFVASAVRAHAAELQLSFTVISPSAVRIRRRSS